MPPRPPPPDRDAVARRLRMARAGALMSGHVTADLATVPTLTVNRIHELTAGRGSAYPTNAEVADLARIWETPEAFLRHGYDEAIAERLRNLEDAARGAAALLERALAGPDTPGQVWLPETGT